MSRTNMSVVLMSVLVYSCVGFSTATPFSALERTLNRPMYSPDGQTVFFGAIGNIYAMKVDSKSVRQVTQGGGYYPAVSADGKRLVYLKRAPNVRNDDSQSVIMLNRNVPSYHEIWEANVDGTNAKRVYYSDLNIGQPFFAPDGTTILFAVHNIARLTAERSTSPADWAKETDTYTMDPSGTVALLEVPDFHVTGIYFVDVLHNSLYLSGWVDGATRLALLDLATKSVKILDAKNNFNSSIQGIGVMAANGQTPQLVALSRSKSGPDMFLIQNLSEDIESGVAKKLRSEAIAPFFPETLTYSEITGKFLVGGREIYAQNIWIERMFEVDPATGNVSQITVNLPRD